MIYCDKYICHVGFASFSLAYGCTGWAGISVRHRVPRIHCNGTYQVLLDSLGHIWRGDSLRREAIDKTNQSCQIDRAAAIFSLPQAYVGMFWNHRNIYTYLSLLVEGRSRDLRTSCMAWIFDSFSRLNFSTEREQLYSIVYFEYAIIGTHQFLLDSPGHIWSRNGSRRGAISKAHESRRTDRAPVPYIYLIPCIYPKH